METLTYLAKTNLYLVLFYGCYWLFFRQHTFFQWNRFYLLGSVVASFLLPVIIFSVPAASVAELAPVGESAQVATVVMESREQTFNWFFWLGSCYLLGVAVMLVRLFNSFQKLFALIRRSERIEVGPYTLLLPDHSQVSGTETGSFSFMKWMIVNRRDYENDPDTIFQHEYVHIRQWHSIDILLVEMLKVVFWVNPVVWLYKRSMQTVHEYLADTEAANRDHYANFLISYALNVPGQVLANHFYNSSLLKNRILMIYKKRTSKWSLGKYLLILPVIGLTVFLTAARAYVPAKNMNSAVDSTGTTKTITGTISDQKGNRIPGAIIVIKNASHGAVTDANGHFKLGYITKDASIVASHIQFKSKEVRIEENRTNYEIAMEADHSVAASTKLTGSVPANNPSIRETPGGTAAAREGFKVVEQKPEFPGGHNAMLEYLRQNMKYPEAALKANVSGTVYIRFVVGKDGAINSVVIVRGLGFGADAESVRLVKNMPKWKPGIQNGEPLAMEQTIEIKFDLAAVKGDKRQGFHLPDMDQNWAVNMRVAEFEIKDLLESPLSFFENEKIKPSSTPPKANYRFVPDSSHYRFMNYNMGWYTKPPSNVLRLQTSGQYKYHKERTEKEN